MFVNPETLQCAKQHENETLFHLHFRFTLNL